MHLFVVKFRNKMLNDSLLNDLIFSQQLYIDEGYLKMLLLFFFFFILFYYKLLFIGCIVKKELYELNTNNFSEIKLVACCNVSE